MPKLIPCLLLPLTAFSLVGLGQISRARACSAPIRGLVGTREMIPGDGSTGVPTNVRIVLGYETTSPGITDHPRLQTADGDEVPMTVTQPLDDVTSMRSLQTFVMVPAAPLQPSTKYTVLSDIGPVPCVQNQFSTGMGSTPLCFAGSDGGDCQLHHGPRAGQRGTRACRHPDLHHGYELLV
jgi:hypothetical protein